MVSRADREIAELEGVFKALAHPARRHILIVVEAGGGRVSAGQIADRFAHSWPTTTRHLKLLADAGLLSIEAEGRERFYSLNKDLLFRVGRDWFENFEEEK
jgi:DNA-binding transcriptional ArsR family regulator